MRTGRVALLVVLALMLASCQEAAEETAATPSDDLQAYCDAVLKTHNLPGEPEEDEGPRVKAFARDVYLPAFEDVVTAAPDEIKEDIDLQLEGAKESAETGSFFVSEEVRASRDRTMAFDHENCDWQTVDATAREYEIDGIPKELKAGATSFKLTNKGKEEHDLAVRKVDDDVTESLAEIFENEEELIRDKKIEFAGGFGARPGATGHSIFQLGPGRYAMACFIIVAGTKDEHHFERGEMAEFTVE